MRVLLLLAVLPLAWAQFPAVCNNDASLTSKTCCPNSCSSHGVCMDITKEVEDAWMIADQKIVGIVCNETGNGQGWPLDVRCQWPLRVFDSVCKCNEGWGGYDCSECDFGYIDDGNGGCATRTADQLLTRRNFANLTDDERKEYFRVVNESKNEEEKKWAVVVDEPKEKGGKFELQDVSTYDMLVMHHFLSTRETGNNACEDVLTEEYRPNFAHENANFLTWHRYYLLIVEREFRRIAKSLKIKNFTLAYWDWSTMGSNKIFKSDLFGELDTTMAQDVTGDLFVKDWPVICNLHYQEYQKNKKKTATAILCDDVRKLCNVSADRANYASLQRGKIFDEPSFLPTDDSINMALTAANYYGDDGFNQRAEGFVELCAGETTPCLYRDEKKTHNNLHNAVHIYIGGHMRDVPTASNDPVFFLHHANVDRMFEAWLQLRNNSNGTSPAYGLNNGGHPGHNLQDYLVPFFPLKTNENMFKRASDLGFKYDTLPWNMVPDSDYGMCDKSITELENYECKKVNGAVSSNFHISLYLISIAGTCAALIVSKLSNM